MLAAMLKKIGISTDCVGLVVVASSVTCILASDSGSRRDVDCQRLARESSPGAACSGGSYTLRLDRYRRIDQQGTWACMYLIPGAIVISVAVAASASSILEIIMKPPPAKRTETAMTAMSCVLMM